MSIPLELMTMLGSGILSGVMTLWGMSIKAKAAQHDRLMDKIRTMNEGVVQARETKNPAIQATRRFIAITAVLAIVVWPKIAAVFWPEIGAMVGYTEWNPGFWFFTDGVEAVKWKTVSGLVITPLDTHLMSAIVGLYFGASIVKNA